MEQKVVHVKCDMCEAEHDFVGDTNGWHREVVAETHFEHSNHWGFEKVEIDLCPKCYERSIAIRMLVHRKKDVEYSNDGNHDRVRYTMTGIDYQWRRVQE